MLTTMAVACLIFGLTADSKFDKVIMLVASIAFILLAIQLGELK